MKWYVADITCQIIDQKRAEAAYSEALEKYLQMFNNSISGISLHRMIFDENGDPIDYVFLDINPAFVKLTGLKKEDIIGERVTSVIPDMENSVIIRKYGDVVKTGKPQSFEQYSEPLGKHYSINAYKLDNDKFVTDFTDITEVIRFQENLIKREKDLNESQRIAHIANWRLDISTNRVEWTEELYTMLGLGL